VIALSTVVSVLACCGVLLFLYRRKYGQKEEDEKELSPYERWMRNEENKGASGVDQGAFRMSAGQGMDVADIYGNSTHNPMGGSPGGIDYYGNPQMMQGGDPRMSGMSNMSGGNMVMMSNPGMMDPRMSGMSNPGMMMPPQGMNGSTHNPMMMGSGGQENPMMMGSGGQDSLHMPAGGMMNSSQQMDDYDYQMDGQAPSPASGKQNPLVRQYRQSLAGRRGGGR
jgi:hypothetical protein